VLCIYTTIGCFFVVAAAALSTTQFLHQLTFLSFSIFVVVAAVLSAIQSFMLINF